MTNQTYFLKMLGTNPRSAFVSRALLEADRLKILQSLAPVLYCQDLPACRLCKGIRKPLEALYKVQAQVGWKTYDAIRSVSGKMDLIPFRRAFIDSTVKESMKILLVLQRACFGSMTFNMCVGGLRHPRDWPFTSAEVAFIMRGFRPSWAVLSTMHMRFT